MNDFFIWAHRGASCCAPENTLAAFRAAEAAGAEGIELDVHLSRDGVAVVIHDETLQRTTSGRGKVKGHGWREISELDAGSWFGPSFARERVPTLEQVLEWTKDRMRLNVEIKSAEAGLAVLSLIGRFPRARVLVSSFDHRLLENLRRSDPGLPLGFLAESRFWRRGLQRATACGAESFHPREDLVTEAMIETCRQAGIAVHPWTVDDPKRIETLRRMGAAGVFTNDPATVARVVRDGQRHPI